MKKFLSALYLSALGICSIQASHHAPRHQEETSKDCICCVKECEACGDLCKACTKAKKGCVTIPQRTQTYFVGDPACSSQTEVVPEAQLFYRAQGKYNQDKPTIVFIHGFAEAGDVWLCAQNELSKCYYTIAMDLRGNGRSTKTPGDSEEGGIHYTLELNATDVHVLLQTLGITGDIILVGHSIGGAYAMKYTLLYPDEVSRLIVTGTFPVFQVPDCALEPDCDTECYNPFTCQEGFCDPFGTPSSTVGALALPLVECLTNGGTDQACLGEWGALIAPLWYSDSCQAELQPAEANLVNVIQSMTPSIIFSIFTNAAAEDQSSELSSITVPTLITQGTADVIVNPGNAELLHSLIPNSALVYFPDRSHQMHVTSYKQFDKLINEFINVCSFPESTIVFDQGCCICPLVQPIDFSRDACSPPPPRQAPIKAAAGKKKAAWHKAPKRNGHVYKH